jgi:hypothetical protein
MYLPSTGRFDHLDPFAGNPNDPLSFNKYGFVHGDPIQNRDPSGKYLMAVDGTGSEGWLRAETQNPNKLPNGRWLTHVKNFAEEYGGRSSYEDGPSEMTWASDMPEIENAQIQKLIEFRGESPANKNEPIDIIGWSRGAYSALRLARRLKYEGIRDTDGTWVKDVPVRFLGLYDPVDMTFYDAPTWDEGYYSQSTIPSNVQTAISIGGKKEGVFESEVDYDNGGMPWYNWTRMEIRASQQTNATISKIGATHGAIGGCPGYSPFWSVPVGYNYQHDAKMSITVDKSIRSKAASVGVPIRVLGDAEYGFPNNSPTPSRGSTVSNFIGSFSMSFGIGFGGF